MEKKERARGGSACFSLCCLSGRGGRGSALILRRTFDFCLMLAALVPLSALVPLGLGVLVWGLIVYKILKLNALRRELNALPAPAHGDL